jgi:hypothetical protein
MTHGSTRTNYLSRLCAKAVIPQSLAVSAAKARVGRFGSFFHPFHDFRPNSVRATSALKLAAPGDVTPYSRSARTPSPRNRGRAMLSAGGVCLDSACDWWHRLLGVFPACDFEPGSVFGLITGDPDPVTPCRKRVVPVCNTDL